MADGSDNRGVSVDIHLHVHFSATNSQPTPTMQSPAPNPEKDAKAKAPVAQSVEPVEEGQTHTIIEIDAATYEQARRDLELRLAGSGKTFEETTSSFAVSGQAITAAMDRAYNNYRALRR